MSEARARTCFGRIDYNQIKLPTAYVADFNIVRANVLAGCSTNAACAVGAPMFQSMGNSGSILAANGFGVLVCTGQIAELAWQQLIAGNIPNTNTTPVPAGNLRSTDSKRGTRQAMTAIFTIAPNAVPGLYPLTFLGSPTPQSVATNMGSLVAAVYEGGTCS
jgi:hypothetical protein